MAVRWVIAWILAIIGSCSAVARAEDAPPPVVAPVLSPKRPLPDYSGRAPRPVTFGEVMLWVPRILLSPLYLTSEFLLRRPIGALTIAAERADLPRKLYDFFAFGPDHKAGIVPVGLVEFGFNPGIGFWGFWNDAFRMKGNELRVHYEVWPPDWYGGSITDRAKIDDSHTLELRVSGMRRPDQVFYGIGPSSLQSSQSRYSDSRLDAHLTLETRPWRTSRIDTTLGFRKVDLSPGHFGSDPSLENEAVQPTPDGLSNRFPIPYGFNRGYLDVYSRVLVALDTRRDATRGSGVRLELGSEQGSDVKHSPASAWIRWGGVATACVDLNDYGRVLSLSVATQFADPLDGQQIPFTELVSLGGDKWMHGFFPGRLVDRSMAVASLRYAWPIAPWLGGTLQAAVGNVWGEHLDGFDPGLLRLSAGGGFATTSDVPVELIVGFGTDTFDHGAEPQSFRVSLGVPHSF